MKSANISVFGCALLLMLFVAFQGCQEEEGLGGFDAEDPVLVSGTELVNVDKLDGSYELPFSANLPWRAKSNSGWIAVDASTDQGEAGDFVIKFTTSKNPTEQPRSGSIMIWITKDYSKTITVDQPAGDPPPVIKRNVYVKADGTSDGASWETAMSLTGALALNLDVGDIIHIAAGTYSPEAIVTGGTDGVASDKTFEIRQDLVLIGGYPANATTGAEPDPSVNTTILDGGNTANHVVTVSAPLITNQKVVVKGVTIKNGNTATSASSVTINGLSYSKTVGGGIIVGKAVVQLDSCIITDNTAFGGGGGIYGFTNAVITLNKSVVKNNTVTSTGANGGGLFIEKQSTLYVYNSSISSNGAGSFAGGLYQYTGAFHMYNTTIDGNGAGGVGSATAGKAYGAVYLREGSGELVNCTVYGNTSSNIGGAVGVYGTASAGATLDIVSSTITANKIKSTTASGGGLYSNSLFGTINVYNTIISGNTKGATGTESVSDVDGVAGFAWSKRYTIASEQVFDGDGNAVGGATFDFASMLGPLTNNGGETSTVKLTGSSNPALTNGMNDVQLTELGNTLSTSVPASIIAFDQTGESRSGKAYIGATVK